MGDDSFVFNGIVWRSYVSDFLVVFLFGLMIWHSRYAFIVTTSKSARYKNNTVQTLIDDSV